MSCNGRAVETGIDRPLMTTRMAATVLEVSQCYVTQAIHSGGLEGVRAAAGLLVTRESIDGYLMRDTVRARRSRNAARGVSRSTRELELNPLLTMLLPAGGCGVRISVAEAARQLRVDRSQLYLWRDRGLTLHTADRLAVAAGYHPGEVWGDAWWEASRVEGQREAKRRHPTARFHVATTEGHMDPGAAVYGDRMTPDDDWAA